MTWQDTFEDLGWHLRNLCGGQEAIIGPREPLPPIDIHLRDLRDYSGTASLNEITHILKARGFRFHNCRILKNSDRYASQPTFNLGNFLKISKGKVKPTQDIWLQEKSVYQNIAILGPPGSGKTEGLIVPNIKSAIDAGLSNIVIDVKGGVLIDKIGKYARQKGIKVIYWSTHPEEVNRSHSINLLDNIHSEQDAQTLAKSLYGNLEDLGENRQFAIRDIRWMAEWILLVKHIFGERATLRHIYQIAQNPRENLTQLLRRCQDRRLQRSIQSQLRLIADSESGDAAFTWAIQDAIGFFEWPNFEQVTGHSDLLLRDIQRQPTLLVIGAELSGREVSKKISSALIDILMTIFYERWTQNNEGQGIVFWIDEFPRIQKQLDIAEFTSVARSARGSIVIAAQNLEQISQNYREQVMENFNTVILCRNVGFAAAEWLSNRLGNCPRNFRRRRRYNEAHSEDDSSWFQTRRNRERYETWRESAPVLDIREIQYPIGNPYVAVVHSRTSSRKPFLVDYERVIEPSTPWQPIPRRLTWQEPSFLPRRSSRSNYSRLTWHDRNSAQRRYNEQQNRLRQNWRDSD